MLDELGVATLRSEMSFGVSAVDGSFAYSTRTPRTLFAHPRSLSSRSHRHMVVEIFAFLSRARSDHECGNARGLALEAYLEELKVSPALRERFVFPLAGALWSCGRAAAAEFPAEAFLGFLGVHGMLRPAFAPRWRTVRGGSATYVAALREALSIEWRTGVAATRLLRRGSRCVVELSDQTSIEADGLIVATHADRALALLDSPTNLERSSLGAISYTDNEVVVHSDESALPSTRGARASWNYRVGAGGDVEVTYWCNRLQRIPGPTAYMVTLNPTSNLDPSLVHHETRLRHPRFNLACLDARRALSRAMGERRTYYAGAYFGYGFHEDGFRSGTAAASALLSDLAAWRVGQVAA